MKEAWRKLAGWFQRNLNWPVSYAWWEWAIMRAAFAWVVWRSIPERAKYTEQRMPHGFAHVIDFTFLADPQVAQWLTWGLWLALLAYVIGRGMIPALAYMSFLSIAHGTLKNSQGAIGHTTQIISLVLLAQLAAYVAAFYHSRKGTAAESIFKTPGDRAIDWTKQMICFSYLVSAVVKLDRSDGLWIWHTPRMALQIIKSARMDFYNKLDALEDWRVDIAELILEQPMLARVAFGSGLVIELFAFLALMNRRYAVYVGVILIIFHSTISVFMRLDFKFHKLLALIFFINVPWLLWKGFQALQSRSGGASPPQ